jgi:nitrile hydratase accessory protein
LRKARSQTLPPAFDAPWQAQGFAMAQALIESGRITAADWATALGAALRQRHADGAPDTTDTYFEAVTDALEAVLALEKSEVRATMAAWRRAYETTAHGKPVKLPD